jgi:rhodanese-related sulfurtransferase
LVIIAFINSTNGLAKDYPLRAKYPKVEILTQDAFLQTTDAVIFVDVRSEFEYNVLHIDGAKNISVSNRGFIPQLKALRANSNKTIIFYCNGIDCQKSYQAYLIAKEQGVSNMKVYDSGVEAALLSSPTRMRIFGKPASNAQQFIDKQKLEAHLLDAHEFMGRANKEGLLIDIRDPFQKKESAHSSMAVSVPLDYFENFMSRLNPSAPLFIFDAVGKQVIWLQYLLEEKGVKEYYFLKGGIASYQNYRGHSSK